MKGTNDGRQIKGNKAQIRPEKRTPPLRETHDGRQMKGKEGGEADATTQGDTFWETNEGRQGADKTGEADTTNQGDT